MRSGLLRNPVELLKRERQVDASGGPYSDWITQGFEWMSFDPEHGRERSSSGREIDPQTVRFRCRYTLDITSDMRLRHDGVEYTITGHPQPRNGRNRELLIQAVRVENGNG